MGRARRILGAAVTLFLLAAPLSAQQPTGTVRGRVVDGATQQPLVGVTVAVADRGALTQADGRYTIPGVSAGTHTVRAVMLGYAELTQSVTVIPGQTATLDFALSTQAVALSELVVVGYGQQRARELTTSVKQLTPKDFNTGVVFSPEQLIESKVAGVQVVDNNEPGGGLSVRIRGATSVNASSNPLYVIDGVPVIDGGGVQTGGVSATSSATGGRNPLNFLNPNDIESITVLKDAAAAAIYGSNAANGVVIITTKSARRGTQIEYTGTVSGSSVTRLPSMLNAAQFRTAVQQYAAQNASQLGSASTDWFGLIDRTGYGQEHNLAISNSTDAANFRLSMGYLNQNGIIKGSSTERISAALNYDQHLFRDYLTIRNSLKGSRVADGLTPGGVLSNAAQMGPTQPVNDANGTAGYYEWPGNTLQSADNPVAILNRALDQGTTYRSLGNSVLELRMPFLQALKGTVNLGYDVTRADHETFTPSDLHSQTKASAGGSAYEQDKSLLNTLLETYLNYSAPLKALPGNVDVTGGYSYSKSHGSYPYFTCSQLATNLLGANGCPGSAQVQVVPDVQDAKLISFFGRLNYSLNDRYLLAASVRRDGSSRFGSDHAWGVFPSVAGAWRVSQESFMTRLPIVSDLKLRASWGKTGNQAFANYQYISNFVLGDAQTQYPMDGTWVTTLRPSAVDPNIKWEETSSTNIGLDYGFANQRFTGSIDYYVKKTKDLIFTVPIVVGTNLSNFLTTNIGDMRNKGIEASLSAQILRGGAQGFSWSMDLNAAHNTNELVQINPNQGTFTIATGSVAGGVGTHVQVLMAGQPINSFYLYEQLYQNGKPVQGSYADLNGDGQITLDDRRPIHDPAPKWILGATSNVNFRKWDASFTLRSYLGSWVYNNIASNLGTYSELGRASPYNLHSSVLTTGFTSPQYLSDYYLEDGSFLRMDNITVGYTLSFLDRPLRVFGTVQNAFTLTGYSGVDPTAGLNGIDNNIYPRSRTFTAGVTAQF